MSLEELRKQAEEEEANEALEAEPAEEDQEADAEDADSDGQPEGDPELEESEDFELEVDGEPEPDQQKPSAEEALIHKLTKQRKRTKEAESELDAVKRQLEELQKSISQPQKPAPVSHAAEPRIPDLYDKEIDGDREKYDTAMKQWYRDMAAYQSRHSQADQAQEEHKQKLEGMTKNLAIRAARFATENKVKVDRVVDALDKATSEIDAIAGVDGAMAYLLDSVGDGSERVACYIGTNESARAQLKRLLEEDRNGLKAIAHMTRLVEKLKPKHTKQLSKAPEPDQSINGDKSSSVTAEQLQKQWDKETDANKLLKIKQKAREMGVKLA